MYDIAVIGGGIIGAMLTRSLSIRYPTKTIALLEKESALGLHTSTRNSAVLHAGFYYNTDSIKAKLCRDGNQQLTQYCIDNKIKLNHTGKFLVARNAAENERLEQIKAQGDINQVELELMDKDRALKIEKYLKVYDNNFRFLYSPTTKVGDNKGIMQHLQQELQGQSNVKLLLNSQYVGNIGNKIQLKNNQTVEAKYIINSGGLYADVIAKNFNFGQRYTIWPFKGTYLIANTEGMQRIPQAKAIIYPVPPLKGNYFLGIHTTLTVEDQLKIGPSIFPALWRENYSMQENFKLDEFINILGLNVKNVLSKDLKFYMQSLILELKKIRKSYMLSEAMKLTTQLDGIPQNQLSSLFERSRPGIRSQLYDTVDKKMVQDFIIEHDSKSMHLLNVASPGWTCSIPMAEYICDILKEQKYI